MLNSVIDNYAKGQPRFRCLSHLCAGHRRRYASATMAAAIYFTHNLLEMFKWDAITGAAQIAVFSPVNI